MKKISEFLSEKFQFLVVKFSMYLNRRVFVMQVGTVNFLLKGKLLTLFCLLLLFELDPYFFLDDKH